MVTVKGPVLRRGFCCRDGQVIVREGSEGACCVPHVDNICLGHFKSNTRDPKNFLSLHNVAFVIKAYLGDKMMALLFHGGI